MRINRRNYIFEYNEDSNEAILYNSDGERYLKMPASVLFTESSEEIKTKTPTYSFAGNTLSVTAESVCGRFGTLTLSFLLNDDSIEVSFEAEAKEDIYVGQTELFRRGRKGLYMVDCIKRFTPAPRNNDGINRSFESVFCDCTMNAYFAPPPLNFCIGNRSGWVAFGLLDLPDSYEYKMTASLGILVENRGGKLVTKKGDTYKAPRLLITFPKTQWESISLFREELGKRNLLPEKRKEIPQWWKRPLLVTYGDQMMDLQYNWYTDDDWGCDAFTTDWLRMWLKRAEGILGENDFTIVIDAFWQHEYSTEAKVDEERFDDLRQFIDECHDRGHKVLLWCAPLIDNPNNGFETLAQRLGVLSPDRLTGGIVDGKYYVDFTSNDIGKYFDEISRKFFSDDADALNCDGLKMDFLAFLRLPDADVHYQNPENGIGIKEMYRFYDEFQKAAVKVKSDVLLNGSGCDPRFENVMAMNRLHDIQNVYEERELRARASALACPNLLIDSDGAIMLTDWVKETYIKAAIYSTPSLYYVNKFHDGIRLPDDEMIALKELLSLSSKKTDGVPFYNEDGDWELIDENGNITAHTFGGDSVYVYDGKGELSVFSWNGGKLSIPLKGYRFLNLPKESSYDGENLNIELVAGKVYKLSVERV